VKNHNSAACTIYHNPRCSKSRATLELLQQQGVAPVVIEYLRAPLNIAELKSLLAILKMQPEELVRKSEEVYQAVVADKNLTSAQLMAAMADNPILIERPIVVMGERAVLGRPPDNVLQLFNY
jgi:arsenate reductase (glutaredoxin)